MNDILPFAKIDVEVLNPNCWQSCEDFSPWISWIGYKENQIYERRFECRNLDKCRRLAAYLERSEK